MVDKTLNQIAGLASEVERLTIALTGFRSGDPDREIVHLGRDDRRNDGGAGRRKNAA